MFVILEKAKSVYLLKSVYCSRKKKKYNIYGVIHYP